MDRGKAKMTADDIAAEHRAKKRKSQMSSGETLRLQPSREIPENEMYDTMLQQQLDTGYMPAPENAWCVNPWIVRVSAPMPISLAPQMFGNPCIIPASAPIPLQSTPQTTTNFPTTIPMPPQIVQGQMFNSPCTVPASAPVPLQSAPKTTTNLPTTIPSPPQIVQGQMQMFGSPCTIPASTPVPLQSAPQTTTTFSTTVPTPPQIVQDQSWDRHITPSMIIPVPTWPFGAMGRPCYCQGSWHFIVDEVGKEYHIDERTWLRIMSRGDSSSRNVAE